MVGHLLLWRRHHYHAERTPVAPVSTRAAALVFPGGPHAIAWTHAGQVNTALLDFLRG
jgi:hypothetical protein